jgi:hypothetical protein
MLARMGARIEAARPAPWIFVRRDTNADRDRSGVDVTADGNSHTNKKTARRSSLSQHQVSVRREASHIRASRFELIETVQTFDVSDLKGMLSMKRQMISAFVALALVAAATAILRSHSTEMSAGTAAMPSLQELHAAADVNKLPNQEIEDHALIFPGVAKR